MKIDLINIEEIKPYRNNAKLHPEKQVDQIAVSIKEFGFNVPILIDENNVIIAGHGRYYAAQKLNMDTIPAIKLEHLTEARKRAFIIADNKLNMNTAFDINILKAELEEIQKKFEETGENFNCYSLGFDEAEFRDLINQCSPDIYENDENNAYTKKIKAPIYEPINEKPPIEELFSSEKTEELIDKIKKSNIPKETKTFLINAAYRHIVFNYAKIADFYAHSDKETQQLMEESALVIIDFDKAIENGFVELSQDIYNQYLEEYPDEE